jgi:hypothetical protein
MVPSEPPRGDGYRIVLGAEVLGEIGPLSSFLHDTGAVVIHLHWQIQGEALVAELLLAEELKSS